MLKIAKKIPFQFFNCENLIFSIPPSFRKKNYNYPFPELKLQNVQNSACKGSYKEF